MNIMDRCAAIAAGSSFGSGPSQPVASHSLDDRVAIVRSCGPRHFNQRQCVDASNRSGLERVMKMKGISFPCLP
jgi:hypothetical protein